MHSKHNPKPQQHLPRPRSPPKLPWPPRSWLWQKGSAAAPGRSTISDICSNKGSNSFDCCGLLGLPEIVWWVRVCVCVCPQKHDAERLTALGWAGGCLSEYSSLRAAVLLQPVESKRLGLRNLRDTSIHFWQRKGIRIWNESWRQD